MKLSYCAQQVYESDRDSFFQSLFIPEEKRDFFHVILALNTELIRIHNNVSEEMIGHIRYAWWYEKIEALYEGNVTQGHPVLEALKPMIDQKLLPKPQLLALVETYRAHYPQMPHDLDVRLNTLCVQLIKQLCPEAKNGWEKAEQIITRHRARHPQGFNGLLSFKLLINRK